MDSRTQQLEASIAAQRANAAALREVGAASGKSLFIASREQGAASVRQSLEVEQQLAARADELAKVREQRKPTPTELLGEDGALYYAVARGLLVSCAGLVFFGAAGALLRAARTAEAGTGAVPAGLPGVRFTAPGVVPQPANDGGFNLPHTGTGHGRTWAWGAAALPLGLATASLAPQPAQANPQSGVLIRAHQERATPSIESHPTPSAKAKRQQQANPARPGTKVDTGVTAVDGSRYQRVRSGVMAGTIKPSTRGIQKVEGGGTRTVRGYLAELEREGLIQRHRRGYVLAEQTQT